MQQVLFHKLPEAAKIMILHNEKGTITNFSSHREPIVSLKCPGMSMTFRNTLDRFPTCWKWEWAFYLLKWQHKKIPLPIAISVPVFHFIK